MIKCTVSTSTMLLCQMSNPFFSALIAGQDLTEGLGPELLEQEVGLLEPDVKNRQPGATSARGFSRMVPEPLPELQQEVPRAIQPGLALSKCSMRC